MKKLNSICIKDIYINVLKYDFTIKVINDRVILFKRVPLVVESEDHAWVWDEKISCGWVRYMIE